MYTQVHSVSGNWTLGLFQRHHFSLGQKVCVIFLSWSKARFLRCGCCLSCRVHCSGSSQIVILWLWLFDYLTGCFWIFLVLLQNSACLSNVTLSSRTDGLAWNLERPYLEGILQDPCLVLFFFSLEGNEPSVGHMKTAKFLRRLSPNLPNWTVVKDSHANSQTR